MRKAMHEVNDRREIFDKERRSIEVNGKTEMLPSDPFKIAQILKERRPKTPASRARARMTAEAKKRGL